MTRPTTQPGNQPTNLAAEDALAARLAATFERATQQAAEDIAQGAAVLRPARPTGVRRLATRPLIATGLTLAAIVALFGVVRLNPTDSTSAASASPSASAGTATPAPIESLPANATVFPVDSSGSALHQVLSSTDATPIYLSGWLIGTQPPFCYVGSGGDCNAFGLHAAPGGGVGVVLDRPDGVTIPGVSPMYARWVVVRVHTHDASCREESCVQVPVLDGVVRAEDQQAIVLPDPASAPVGISRELAIRAALDSDPTAHDQLFVSAVLGILGTDAPSWPYVDATRYAWDVELRPSTIVDVANGEHIFVDNETGERLDASDNSGAAPAVLPGPSTSVPPDLAGVPVYQGDAARAAFDGQPASILVGGWLQGVDRAVCEPPATAAQGSALSPCTGLWLHPGPDGGVPITMSSSDAGLADLMVPPEGASVPAVVRVHLTSQNLPGGGSTFVPVADAVVWLGNRGDGLALGAPPDGLSMSEADKAGVAYRWNKAGDLLYGSRITLGAFEAITGSRLSAPDVSQDSWVWLLVYPNSKVLPYTRSTVVVTVVDGRPLLGSSSFP